MTALDPREAARLRLFLARVLEPTPFDDTHKGLARGLLASKIRWREPDLAFLRATVCAWDVSAAEWLRLNALFASALERRP